MTEGKRRLFLALILVSGLTIVIGLSKMLASQTDNWGLTVTVIGLAGLVGIMIFVSFYSSLIDQEKSQSKRGRILVETAAEIFKVIFLVSAALACVSALGWLVIFFSGDENGLFGFWGSILAAAAFVGLEAGMEYLLKKYNKKDASK